MHNLNGIYSSQRVTETINEQLTLQRGCILETAVERNRNNWKDLAFQVGPMQIDSDWEETLNDIDELIQSELGCSLTHLPHDITRLSSKLELRDNNTQSQTGTNASSIEPLKWNLSDLTLQQSQKPTTAMSARTLNKNPDENVEVQIMDLKDVYEKKTTKGSKGFGYRLENSEVTIVVCASLGITKIRAYVQRCARAAMRTHDITGPVELDASVLESQTKRQVICVDLSSVYKKHDRNNFYWLEKADVVERNKWEITIKIWLASGLTASVTSRPFQVATKVNHMRNSADFSNVCKVQKLSCKITKQQNHLASDTQNDVDDTFLERIEITKETAAVEGDADYDELSQEILYFNIDEKEGCLSENSTRGNNDDAGMVSNALDQERIILQPNSTLQRHMLESYYSCKSQVNCILEQPQPPALLKLEGKRSILVSDQQKKTKRKKSRNVENYSWACGYCFFERRKKSTITTHLIQGVCQRPRLQRLISKKRRSLSASERRSSSGFKNSELKKHKPASSKRSRSL